jgi:hypothetical protein
VFSVVTLEIAEVSRFGKRAFRAETAKKASNSAIKPAKNLPKTYQEPAKTCQNLPRGSRLISRHWRSAAPTDMSVCRSTCSGVRTG